MRMVGITGASLVRVVCQALRNVDFSQSGSGTAPSSRRLIRKERR